MYIRFRFQKYRCFLSDFYGYFRIMKSVTKFQKFHEILKQFWTKSARFCDLKTLFKLYLIYKYEENTANILAFARWIRMFLIFLSAKKIHIKNWNFENQRHVVCDVWRLYKRRNLLLSWVTIPGNVIICQSALKIKYIRAIKHMSNPLKKISTVICVN